ncbi:helix-turn-helix domain-containing protein [Alkalicoccobacillus plakortidis]|uniref:Helix-turn-helix domain-containing protein n=1 Tax=Alkalicoccobacillus plakortidis TaxID=444060 RepID=A0ABT0XK03_9BACI|nr:helix-turn-helix transcriptional regulator [Alkalicoccobacillus plakortidis]MCM2675552.1 helix-turn-helix domain-containing protein [Alkalicoccobacillus plakortidis]
MAEFGKYLKAMREQRGLGVNQLAALSGVSSSLISRVENEKRGAPKSSTLDELAKVLKASQVEFYFMAGHVGALEYNQDFIPSDLALHYLSDEDKKLFNKDKLKQNLNDERDIAKRMEAIRKDLKTPDGLNFSGEPLSEEAIESLLEAMEYAVRQTQRINKKYVPKKYRDNN